MHLLQLGANDELSLAEFYGNQIPKYAILSHTWIANHEEVTFKDIMKGKGKAKAGYEKLRFIAKQATLDGLHYFWVDTCCINKASSAELQEAINSMFRWYQRSTNCYVYLSDVSSGTPSSLTNTLPLSLHRPWKPAFFKSRWFTRGWTLQELLAPPSLQFFSREGTLLGDKMSLGVDIEQVTSIPLDILQGDYKYLLRYDVEKRLSWAAERKTTREEDAAYSLLGLFDLHLPLLYGEGRTKAFMRLHRERESVTTYKSSHIQVVSSSIDDRPVGAEGRINTNHASSKRTADEAFRDRKDVRTDITALQSSPQTSDTRTVEAQEPRRDMERSQVSKRVLYANNQISVAENSSSDPSYVHPTRVENIASDQAASSTETSMKMWWNDSIARNLNTPEDYTQVAVLLIKWSDELDELKTRNEVEEMDNLFRGRFRFRTEIFELNIASKPQHQLNQCISSFIGRHDGPNNLLIVYYTGHGVYKDLEHYLQLAACSNPDQAIGLLKDAYANWTKVEEVLRSEDVEADVLTILDTCYAAAPWSFKNEQSKRFELMCACAIDQTTAAPGRFSFTRVLIDSLVSILERRGDEPISTFRLLQQINLDTRRSDTVSHLWSTQRNGKPISLRPMKSAQVQRYEMFRTRVGGRLTLEFELRDEVLSQEQIKYLAQGLGKAFKDKRMVGLRKINWLRMVPVEQSHAERVALVKRAVSGWKEFIKRRREQRLAS